MSVAQQLGLTEPYGDLMVCAGERWGRWRCTRPVLDVCEDLQGLRDWVRQAEPHDANQVLLALGELGAVDGHDDPAATTALLWLLLPGAVGIARSLQPLSTRIDELVAAQLWICARTLSWSKGIWVAATVLMNTRREVLTDLGLGQGARAARTESASPDLDLVLALAGPSAHLVGHTKEHDHLTAEADYLHGLLQVTRRLLRAGADPDLRDTLNRSPREVAVMRGFVDVAAELAPATAQPGVSMARFLRE